MSDIMPNTSALHSQFIYYFNSNYFMRFVVVVVSKTHQNEYYKVHHNVNVDDSIKWGLCKKEFYSNFPRLRFLG